MRGACDVPEPDEARVGLTGLVVPPKSLIGFGDNSMSTGTPMLVRMWTPPPKLPLGDAPGIPTAPPALLCTKKPSNTW